MRPARNFQNAPHPSLSSSSSLLSTALGLLCMLGIAGTVFHMLTPGGLLEPIIVSAWETHPAVAALTVLGLVAGARIAKSHLESYDRPNTDAFWYLFQSLGVYFAYRLITMGTL
jgi:hypothetical protein